MFLIIVDYKKPLEEVERYLAEHWAFLDRYFAQGKLLCTGPQNPRTGSLEKRTRADILLQTPLRPFEELCRGEQGRILHRQGGNGKIQTLP